MVVDFAVLFGDSYSNSLGMDIEPYKPEYLLFYTVHDRPLRM